MTSSDQSAALAPLDVPRRLRALKASLGAEDLGALIVHKLENIRYLSGFSGSAGILVVRDAQVTLITDGRYQDQAPAEIAAVGAEVAVEVARGRSQRELLGQLCGDARRVGLEADAVTWSQQRALAGALDVELVPTQRLVEMLRRVKDPGEIARIARACAIADDALGEIAHLVEEAISESDFAAELEFKMRLFGSEAQAFATIVASGPNGALPHARPTGRTIQPGELVVVDFGATVEGYRSDMTRTIWAGDLPADLVELFSAVRDAQAVGVAAVRAGVTCGSIDAACRDRLIDVGFGEKFTHSTGHGVGLEIHEAPWVAAASTDILEANTVVTVEPGAYLVGRGGVRIEDTVVVTEVGARALTQATKDHQR